MARRSAARRLFYWTLIPCVGVTLGCGAMRSNPAPVLPAPAASAEAVPALELTAIPQVPVQDPIVTLIEASDRHFRQGQKELGLGHVEAARQEFDRAVNVLLESPYGGRTEPRIREHFDRLIDRISAYEV